MTVKHFEVQRANLRAGRFVDEPSPSLQDGQALLRVGRFALTANNITYAVFGDAMAYWAFFPASSDWGRIPVWGHAVVQASRHPQLREGESVFGFLPMSTHLVVRPDSLGRGHFVDVSPHRLKLPAAYQMYARTPAETAPDPAFADRQAIFRPLFVTSFLIEDFLFDNAMFGARAVVLSSASSKTALGLAHRLRQRQACEVIGLTSPAHGAFCTATGVYDRVLAYADWAQLDANRPTVFVDMAGNGRVLHDLHHHFGDQLRYSCTVGGTHWEQRQTQHKLPGARPTFFFAPTQWQKRAQDWGAATLESRIHEAMSGFIATTQGWLTIEHGHGTTVIEAAYRRTLEGATPPDRGQMLSY